MYPGLLTLAHPTDIHDAWEVPRVPSAAAVHIGELMAGIRVSRGLMQDDLAHLTRIDSSNIRSYEKGGAMMSVPTLVRVADALRIEPGELLDGVKVEMLNVAEVDGRRRA